jgi:hypothetical protein
MFTLSRAILMQQTVGMCPGPVGATISGWKQYSDELPSLQQETIDNLADLIVSSFVQSRCPPFRSVSVVGHADKDWQGPKHEVHVSFKRAMTVQKALTDAVKDLWVKRNMGPPPVGGVAWGASGEGSKQMIAPAYNDANRRVVVTLTPSGAPEPPRPVSQFVSPRGTPINPKKIGKMINIFGERETEPGFVNYTSDPKFAVGQDGVTRPWTHDTQVPPGLDKESAGDICLRSSPLSPTTLDEIQRIGKRGARVTIALSSGPKDDIPGGTDAQLQHFREKFPNATPIFDGVHHGVDDQGKPTDRKVIVVELP